MRDGREIVLLVERDMDTANAQKALLEEGRYETVTVQDGKAAIEYLERHPYDTDIVLIALELPDTDGAGLLGQIKRLPHMNGIPAVLMMPSENEEKMAEALENGAEDIILWPCEKAAAANRIRNILAARKHLEYENVMEEFVSKELDKCIDTLGLCKCRQCRRDVVALTLNHLRPRYASTEKGRLLCATDQLSYDYVSTLLRVITDSVKIVKNNPRHEIPQS